ncbi:MAG: FAD:protein FMN transferase [Pirellulales bacterium]
MYSTHLQELVQKELERIESNLSHWRPESESSLINQSNTTTAMEVSEELATLLELCLRLSRDTQGAYDITVGPLVNLWGFGPDRNVSLLHRPNRLQKRSHRSDGKSFILHPKPVHSAKR